AALAGPAPSGSWLVGGGFVPEDRWNHGTLQFFDRIVRSTDQLGERMTMVLHDWLAINGGDVGARAMIASVETLRNDWRGSFRQLMLDMTIDPAMLSWLSGLGSDKRAPNENYAREIMELFCLGADRGAYTEADIREFARAFTGWQADWSADQGLHNHRFNPKRWDAGEKVFFRGTSYEKRGAFDWKGAVGAVIDHPMHPSFVALKLWGAFIPTPPTPATLAELESLYRSGGERLEPLVEAILLHPDLYTGPSVTKSPVTYVAGLLRSRNRGLKEESWSWLLDSAGQAPWYPPNVSGWNEKAWLNTTTFAARWGAITQLVREDPLEEADYKGSTETPEQAVDAALAFWGRPSLSVPHRAALVQHATEAMTTFYWNNAALKRALRQNTLRMLVVAAPDHQVS
ncbi:MAG: DUF1800 family protein, partial [Solirubrobacteraceae bacterium]|nr:DUF1800 family protein [Solirubrobacteraceae bacterium]